MPQIRCFKQDCPGCSFCAIRGPGYVPCGADGSASSAPKSKQGSYPTNLKILPRKRRKQP